MRPHVAAILALAGLAVLALDGCFYMQAARGQYEVMSGRRPVEEVVADTEADAALRERLQMVLEARQFAVDELLLPDNDSYRSYNDLERDYVLWNVFAAPEFSMTPRTWCFPVAGCVAYRGYFKQEAAHKQADKLEAKGFDVWVGGVPAYSTLGRFSDPILNTMMRWSDVDLVATLFHELAHQQLYVKGDTAFNESYATAVANIGLARWLEQRNETPLLDDYVSRRDLRRKMLALAAAARADLEALYASELDEATMRARKAEVLDGLVNDAESLVAREGNGRGNWLRQPLNNARLASIGLYDQHVNVFNVLYRDCEQDLSCFYAAVERLADLDKEQRHSEMAALATTAVSAP